LAALRQGDVLLPVPRHPDGRNRFDAKEIGWRNPAIGLALMRCLLAAPRVLRRPALVTGNPLDALKSSWSASAKRTTRRTATPPAHAEHHRDTGEFLSVLVRAAAARRILEIGTSNGYSTLWLSEGAAATGGSVTTVEFAAFRSTWRRRPSRARAWMPSSRWCNDDAGAF